MYKSLFTRGDTLYIGGKEKLIFRNAGDLHAILKKCSFDRVAFFNRALLSLALRTDPFQAHGIGTDEHCFTQAKLVSYIITYPVNENLW